LRRSTRPAGTVTQAYGNLFQLRENLVFSVTPAYVSKAGGEIPVQTETAHTLGSVQTANTALAGGAAYVPGAPNSNVPVITASKNSAHNLYAGDLLPDTLSSLLIGSPVDYSVSVAPP